MQSSRSLQKLKAIIQKPPKIHSNHKKNLQEITTTTQKPPGISGNHQKAKRFCASNLDFAVLYGLFGRVLLRMFHQCLPLVFSKVCARCVRCNNPLMKSPPPVVHI